MRKFIADVLPLLEFVFDLIGALIIWWMAFDVAYAMLPEVEDKALLVLDFYRSVAWWGFAFISLVLLILFQNSIHANWQNPQKIVIRWSVGFFVLSYIAFLLIIIQAWTVFIVPLVIAIAHLILSLVLILNRRIISQ